MRMELDSSNLLVSESPKTPTKKSKKKRKREKERDEGAAAAQLQNEPTINEQPRFDVKLHLVNNQFDKTPPVVGYFPSGYNPHKTNDINDAQEPNLLLTAPPSVKLYRNAQRTKVEKSSGEKSEKGRSSERLELVVSPNESNVEFVGNSYKGEAMAAQLCTYALGFFDKATQTLKIMPIAGNKVINFFVGLLFLRLLEQIGPLVLYTVFGSFCLVAVFFVKKNVLETKGKSLQEIEIALMPPE